MSEGRRLLFSVTKDDCTWQAYRGSGPGGQHRNKVSTAVRCIHPPSGAVGHSESDRSQLRNKQLAFRHMLATPEFKLWHRLEVSRRLGQKSVEQLVDEGMEPNNLLVECRTDNGWEVVEAQFFEGPIS